MKTETVENFPLCSHSKQKFLFWTYDRLYRLPGKFGEFICEQCNLIRLSPRPTVDTIGFYYPEDYGAYRKPTVLMHSVATTYRDRLRDSVRNTVLSSQGYDTGKLSRWQKLFRPLLTKLFHKGATYGYGDLFPSYITGGKALEVGCGNGTFLNILKRYGWNVVGVDLSPHAAQAAKELFDIDVFTGQLEDAPFPENSFDYIHLSHVVEHFYDPLEAMKKVRTLLKPGGTVYIEVPNAEGIGAQMSKEYWYGWDAPRHLFMFTPETLKNTVNEAGLSITKLRTRVWDSFPWADTYIREEKSDS